MQMYEFCIIVELAKFYWYLQDTNAEYMLYWIQSLKFGKYAWYIHRMGIFKVKYYNRIVILWSLLCLYQAIIW